MELVLSPGRLGGGDKSGSPFQNQEVREWSHVDRLTGMLEHARIETGRWQTRHQGSAQAYGKVIDSRERNSADGNVVQKARRQVEVFQSHGVGGRSVQVFRASQWSSSRITDSTSSSPVSVSMNDTPFAIRNGVDIPSRLQQCTDDDQSLSKLSQVSRLCRQINGDGYSLTNGRGKISALTDSPSSLFPNTNNRSSEVEKKSEDSSTRVKPLGPISFESNNLNGYFGGIVKRSSSNEDLRKCLEEGETNGAKFYRDCRARRSLQAHKSSERMNEDEEIEGHKNARVKVDKVKTYVLGMREEDSDSDSAAGLKTEFFGLNGTAINELQESCDYLRPTPIILKPLAGSMQIQGKSNATVVHLTSKPNGLIPEVDNSIGIIRPTVSLRSLGSRFSPGPSVRNGDVVNPSAENVQSSTSTGEILGGTREPLIVNDGGSGRPVKRVGFCKTEVHFAAESGKVKIVETDCKPPPSNRFRRRKRGGLGTATTTTTTTTATTTAGKDLPVIHFGDTSYEKLILGVTNGVQEFDGIKTGENTMDRIEGEKKLGEFMQRSEGPDESIIRNGWAARLKTILQSEAPCPLDVGNQIDEDLDTEEFNREEKNKFELGAANGEETIAVDHTFKGHTTTVNLGANVMSKLQKRTNEGKRDTISTGIQLQFNTRLKKLGNDGVLIEGLIKSPTKILAPEVSVAVTNPASRIPRPLTQAHQSSVLKSTRLVMSLNRLSSSSSSSSSFNSLVMKVAEDDDDERVDGSIGVSSPDEFQNSRKEDIGKRNPSSSGRGSPSYAMICNKVMKDFDPGARFAPLRSRLLREDRLGSRKTLVSEASNDSGENQLQYSSGSEQADEEVRSYMLGSDKSKPELPVLLHGIIKFEKSSISTHNRHNKSSNRILYETKERILTHCSAKEVKNNTDSTTADRSIIIGNMIEQKDLSLEDDLDIVEGVSGLPVDEICFEANGTMEKSCLHDIKSEKKRISQSSSDGKVVTSDNENNKVLVNIVETQEPAITTRVVDSEEIKISENVRDLFNVKNSSPRPNLKSINKRDTGIDIIGSNSHNAVPDWAIKPGVVKKNKAKENYCDINGSSSLRKGVIVSSLDPTYVNVFERKCIRKSLERSNPIYENFRGTRRSDSGEKRSPKILKKVLNKARSTSPPSNDGGLINEEAKPSKPELDKEEKKKKKKEEEEEEKKEEEKGKRVSSKARSKRIVAAPSLNSSVENVVRNPVVDTKNRERDQPEAESRSLHNRSTRSSRLHRASILNAGSEKEKSNPERESVKRYATNDKKNIVNHQVVENETIERLTNPVVKLGAKESIDSSSGRSKKPIEIVYQTAVFNMKNEKLAKSSRSKESKTPRYINDLICGSKPKRTSGDARHVKGAAQSQQRVHHKSSSPTSRHWK